MTTRRPDHDRLARVFQVLAVPTRVRIVQLLREHPLCVNALARRLGVTATAVSQHLRVLRDAGVVTPVRRGYFIHYGLNSTTLNRWQAQSNVLLGPPAKKRSKPCAKARTAAGTRKR
jgi:DNA-binding transcriptional ArsR family regulator